MEIGKIYLHLLSETQKNIRRYGTDTLISRFNTRSTAQDY